MNDMGRRVYGLGAILLGLIGLAFADFALQWQPVPKGIGHHTELAYASGAILVIAGAAAIWKRSAVFGTAALALFYAAWVAFLHIPATAAQPRGFGHWLGIFEISGLVAGGLAAFATCAKLGTRSAQLVRGTQILLGLCLLVYGLSHVLYPDFTASMVPKWIPPSTTFWAYATAAGHVAAGLALLSGVLARIGAYLLTAMFAAFAVLVHVPIVYAGPHSHLNWCGLGITLALTGAAWSVADASR